MMWQTNNMRRYVDFLVGALFIIGVITGAVYTAKKTDAATASVTYVFSSGQKIVASQVNTNYNDILGAINGNLNTDNILDGGIATADLASDAVTTAKLADSSVTSAKILDATIATADIATHAISSAKLAQANIVYANFSPIGAGQDQGGVLASASITLVADRPVEVSVTNAEITSEISYIGSIVLAVDLQEAIRVNGATESGVLVVSAGAMAIPCSSLINKVFSPGVGTHTFEIFQNFAGATPDANLHIHNCKLQLREL